MEMLIKLFICNTINLNLNFYLQLYKSFQDLSSEIQSSKSLRIINGEYFKCLFCKLLDLLIENLSIDLKQKFSECIKVAVFNDIYTNNAILDYLNNLKNIKDIILLKPYIDDKIQKRKEFDITIDYKSDGEGSVFSTEASLKKIDKLYSFCVSSNDCLILEFLSIFLNSFNKIIGDALSTFIVFEKSLKIFNFSLIDIYNLINQNPNQFEYVDLENISKFKVDEEILKLVEPKQLFLDLENFVNTIDVNAKYFFKIYANQKRLRFYVESSSSENVKHIVKKIKKLIIEHNN